jgi:phospholipid transport system substrate-binding protein
MMSLISEPTRRRLLQTGLAATLVAGAAPAFALNEAEARRLIDSAVGDINKAINSGKTGSALYRDFETIFKRYADVPTIARSVLGPPARSATKAQMRAFTGAFTSYLARKYGKRFRDFKGSEIKVTGARKVKRFQEVRATAKLRGQAPFNVAFMVSDRSGRDKFFDLLIEGISLLKAERSEVGAMLDRAGGNIDRLVEDLKRRG